MRGGGKYAIISNMAQEIKSNPDCCEAPPGARPPDRGAVLDRAARPRTKYPLDTFLLILVWPMMALYSLCAFLLVGTCNVCVAIAKTFKGEIVK